MSDRVRIDDLHPGDDGVLVDPGGAERFPYVDGAEARLLDLFADLDDRSTGSRSIAGVETDWPMRYHLSPRRWAVLDALDLAPVDRVLELGAGCGAITRWLVEHTGSVDAIEGSPLRARTIRERCREVDNLRVVCADITRIEPEPVYDLVTLIGVLEYAPALGLTALADPRAAVVELLRVAHSWLAPGGRLVIAIENQLGLKYLAGHPEDHVGRPYVGVEGYQAPGTPVTFSLRELKALLTDAGLRTDDVLLPFPDYKVPHVLLAADADHTGLDLTQWIPTPFRDPATGEIPSQLNEMLALEEVARAGLLAELSNSFVFVATAAQDAPSAPVTWAARHYAVDRQPALRGRKTLTVVDGEPVIRVEALHPDAQLTPAFTELGFRHTEDDAPFLGGRSLASDLFRGPVPPDESALVRMLREHARWLASEYGAAGDDTPLVAESLLRAEAFDAHPLNVIRDAGSGQLRAIDLEWVAPCPLTLGHACWRAALVVVMRFGVSLGLGDVPPRDLAGRLAHAALDSDVVERHGGSFSAFEDVFQSAVAGSRSDITHETMQRGTLTTLGARIAEAVAADAALRHHAGDLERRVAGHEAELEQVSEALRVRTAELAAAQAQSARRPLSRVRRRIARLAGRN